MTASRHDEFVESAAAYALGSLDAAERERFEDHLRECDACQQEVEGYRRITAGLGASVEPAALPPALKARVMAAATAGSTAPPLAHPVATLKAPPVRPTMFPWLALAASLALAVAAGAYAWVLHTQLDAARRVAAETSARAETLRTQLIAARGDSARSARLLGVLTAPDVIRVTLAGTKAGLPARGQAYWSPSRGLWFDAEGLPVLSPGRVYQLWLVLPKQAPVSGGLMTVDTRGAGTLLSATSAVAEGSRPSTVTVAITDEPAAGSPAPTTSILLAGSAKPQ